MIQQYKTFLARYNGKCPGCKKAIVPDKDMCAVVPTRNGNKVFYHLSCSKNI